MLRTVWLTTYLATASMAVAANAGDSPRRDFGLMKNQRSPHTRLHSVDLGDVRWAGGFWADQFEKTSTLTLPRLWELADPWAWHNMQVAAGLKEGEAKGCYWEDAWIYKWIESACYVYSQTRDPDLLKRIDGVIEVIVKAQQPDGYLATQATLRGLERFSLQHHHELYTMGHLLTAASIHHRVTGKTNFLDVARRVADYVHKTYDGGDPMLANCPVNPSIIMGAVELYRTTGEKRYLQLANIIIDNRGKKRGKIGRTAWGRPLGGTDLNQDRVPLRNAKEVVGHAVFWSYLFAGATDACMETGDKTLIAALERLWTDVVTRKMYVTGGVSPVHKGLSSRSYESGKRTILNDEVHEAAGLPYDLPSATAYNETCGQIGNLMWNWRMLMVKPESRFADVMERTLYNSILSGINVSGKGWSYTNPLRWHGPGHELLSNDRHGRFDPGDRQICCPTNLLRTIASWHGYLYATSEAGLWVHHYGECHLDTKLDDGRRVRLTQKTDYPWDGRVRIELTHVEPRGPFAVMLRIPEWVEGASLLINGQSAGVSAKPQSYAVLQHNWQAGDVIELTLPMEVRMIVGDPRIEQVRNQVAVMRGPIVYCLESVDLPAGVRFEEVHISRDAEWTVRHHPDLLRGVTVLETRAVLVPTRTTADRPYATFAEARAERVPVRLIPCYAWNNRGEPQMGVWLPLY